MARQAAVRAAGGSIRTGMAAYGNCSAVNVQGKPDDQDAAGKPAWRVPAAEG